MKRAWKALVFGKVDKEKEGKPSDLEACDWINYRD
jgi:hypothetical protein